MVVTVKGEVLGVRQFEVGGKKDKDGKLQDSYMMTVVRLFSRASSDVVEYKPIKDAPLPVVGKEVEVKLELSAYIGKGGAALGAQQV